LGGYNGQVPGPIHDNFYPCPVTRTSLKDNSVVGSCGFGLGESIFGDVGLWTYYFEGNDFNSFGESANGLNGVGLPTNCSKTATEGVQDFKIYRPPLGWPVIPQTC
jgi:hypothetical protein